MLVGLLIALQLTNPAFNFGIPWLTYSHLRALHTNAVIFAFVGNGMFMGVYYSLQRLLNQASCQMPGSLSGRQTGHS
jgi:cytochrome c oxidase cbb3-type subunit I/II